MRNYKSFDRLCCLPQHSASADNTNLHLSNSSHFLLNLIQKLFIMSPVKVADNQILQVCVTIKCSGYSTISNVQMGLSDVFSK